MGSNGWSSFLDYMSTKTIGDIFTRQELHLALDGWSTVDTYRLLATKKNFLKIIGRGKYEVIRNFPSYITRDEFYKIPTDNLEYLEYVLLKKVGNYG